MGNPDFQDPEFQREMARRSVEARRRRAEMRGDERALSIIRSKADVLAQRLIDAALGRGLFGTEVEEACPNCGHTVAVTIPSLDPKERYAALKDALMWGIGRPKQMDKGEGSEEDQGDTGPGLRFE